MSHLAHTNLLCECRSDQRSLVLLARNFEEVYPDLCEFGAAHQWQYDARLGAALVPLGSGQLWSTVVEAVNFLRGVLDPARLDNLRAAWVAAGQPLEQQLTQLIHAAPLLKMVQGDSSPLMDILKQHRVETWYQPIVEARSGRVWGHECLMRGRAADGELVGAGTMIEWARQEHLTFMLDRVCRETHLQNAGHVDEQAKQGFFSLNFLPTAIYQPEFCLRSSMAAAERSGLRPEQVVFEVVETEKIADREHLKKILAHYRGAGFQIALDDVGNGYAGLSLMADLKPDLIKIDRELISQVTTSAFHRDVCASLIKLGQENGQKVIAEGVEQQAEIEILNELGVDLYQGYFYGRPAERPVLGV